MVISCCSVCHGELLRVNVVPVGNFLATKTKHMLVGLFGKLSLPL